MKVLKTKGFNTRIEELRSVFRLNRLKTQGFNKGCPDLIHGIGIGPILANYTGSDIGGEKDMIRSAQLFTG